MFLDTFVIATKHSRAEKVTVEAPSCGPGFDGVSGTTSRGASRAWKRSARTYSGSDSKIGGGASVVAKSASQTSKVLDALWKNAASW